MESIRGGSGLAVTAFDPPSPQRISSRVKTEFFPDGLGEFLWVLALVIEIPPLRE